MKYTMIIMLDDDRVPNDDEKCSHIVKTQRERGSSKTINEKFQKKACVVKPNKRADSPR